MLPKPTEVILIGLSVNNIECAHNLVFANNGELEIELYDILNQALDI